MQDKLALLKELKQRSATALNDTAGYVSAPKAGGNHGMIDERVRGALRKRNGSWAQAWQAGIMHRMKCSMHA